MTSTTIDILAAGSVVSADWAGRYLVGTCCTRDRPEAGGRSEKNVWMEYGLNGCFCSIRYCFCYVVALLSLWDISSRTDGRLPVSLPQVQGASGAARDGSSLPGYRWGQRAMMARDCCDTNRCAATAIPRQASFASPLWQRQLRGAKRTIRQLDDGLNWK